MRICRFSRKIVLLIKYLLQRVSIEIQRGRRRQSTALCHQKRIWPASARWTEFAGSFVALTVCRPFDSPVSSSLVSLHSRFSWLERRVVCGTVPRIAVGVQTQFLLFPDKVCVRESQSVRSAEPLVPSPLRLLFRSHVLLSILGDIRTVWLVPLN